MLQSSEKILRYANNLQEKSICSFLYRNAINVKPFALL